eukprot:3227085-Rhodomonas_salina.3
MVTGRSLREEGRRVPSSDFCLLVASCHSIAYRDTPQSHARKRIPGTNCAEIVFSCSRFRSVGGQEQADGSGTVLAASHVTTWPRAQGVLCDSRSRGWWRRSRSPREADSEGEASATWQRAGAGTARGAHALQPQAEEWRERVVHVWGLGSSDGWGYEHLMAGATRACEPLVIGSTRRERLAHGRSRAC